ncbi:MAG: hypothetical protein ACOYXA_01170 [Bacteroidota bacterium]
MNRKRMVFEFASKMKRRRGYCKGNYTGVLSLTSVCKLKAYPRQQCAGAANDNVTHLVGTF